MVLGAITVICWEPGGSLGGVIHETQRPLRETSGDEGMKSLCGSKNKVPRKEHYVEGFVNGRHPHLLPL